VDIATFPAALIAAIAIGLLNSSIKPILSQVSLPPINTQPWDYSYNGVCGWPVLVPGFSVHGILAAILGPVVLSFVTLVTNYLAEKILST